MRLPLAGWPFLPVCTLLGLALGWIPRLLHGPVAHKFDMLFIEGDVAIWAWTVARSSIGWIGFTRWPARCWLPLVGAGILLPLTRVSLGMPGCGLPCLRVNLASAAVLGFVESGLAFSLTGSHHVEDPA